MPITLRDMENVEKAGSSYKAGKFGATGIDEGIIGAQTGLYAEMLVKQLGIDRKKATQLVDEIGLDGVKILLGGAKTPEEREKGLLLIKEKAGLSGPKSEDSDPDRDFRNVPEAEEALRKKRKELEDALAELSDV